jgi:acyl-CoA thioesterase
MDCHHNLDGQDDRSGFKMGDGIDIPRDASIRMKKVMQSKYAALIGTRIQSISLEEVRVEMDLDDKLNGFGIGHGGAVFSLADEAFAIAANQGEFPQVAMSASIKYLKPAKGRLTAVARKAREDDRISVYAVLVYSGSELVAEFEGIGFKLKK